MRNFDEESVMGKLIICNGKQAEKPYYFKLTDTSVYSIEELCYYIYNNIEIIQEDLFDLSLVTWLQEELGLQERGDKLRFLLEGKAGLKDYVVCILCSADYYSEDEIKKLIYIMDEFVGLSPFDKRKKKADNYVKYRQFTAAQTEYEGLLESPDAAGTDSAAYGSLMHNLAVAQINTMGLAEAAERFKEAYERSHSKESLRKYFYALILTRQDERLKQEMMNYGASPDYLEQLQNELENFYEEAEASEGYQVINNLKEQKENGRIVPFYDMAGDVINRWKQEFRKENL